MWLYTILTLSIIYIEGYESSCSAKFCDPNWTPFPNMDNALRGYNVRTADPFANFGDPGFVSQIFVPTKTDEQNRIELATGITASEGAFCVKSLKSERFTTIEQYRKFITESSSSGVNLQIGTEIEVTAGVDIKGIGVSASTTIPPPFTRAWGESSSTKNLEQFFSEKQFLNRL